MTGAAIAIAVVMKYIDAAIKLAVGKLRLAPSALLFAINPNSPVPHWKHANITCCY